MVLFSVLSGLCACKPAGGEGSELNAANGDKKYRDCASLEIPADMACIPGGFFMRGSERKVKKLDTGIVLRDESPAVKIEVSTFLMDKTEVTVAEYDKCVKARGCAKARTNYGRPYSAPKQPKLGASWYKARAFCRWKNKRLPTEAEWEKAARGPEGEKYPWGNSGAKCTQAIVKDKSGKGCGRGTTWPVASRPALRYGLYDMGGNAHEWVNDWYTKSYKKCGQDCSGRDPRGPCGGKDKCPGYNRKIVKGGSWYWPGIIALSSHRRPHYPKNKPYHHFGFRCAKSVSGK